MFSLETFFTAVKIVWVLQFQTNAPLNSQIRHLRRLFNRLLMGKPSDSLADFDELLQQWAQLRER